MTTPVQSSPVRVERSRDTEHKASALTAAELLVDASSDLLRFHREGSDGGAPILETEVPY